MATSAIENSDTAGNKRRQEGIGIRYGWVIFVSLAFQFMAVLWIADLSLTAAKVILIASYIAMGPVLAINLRRPGIALVLIGAVLNFAAIAANGGAMPVAPETLGINPQQTQVTEQDAGYLSWSKDIIRSSDSTRLRPLGDIFSLPGPFTVAYSAGDVIILIGLFVFAGSIVISSRRDQGHLSQE